MISIKQLRYALAAEKTLHFKKAADLCHVSQSAFSSALRELETHLGLQIFERDNKKVLVTPAGREALNCARKILLEFDDLQHLANRQKTPMSYSMSIGMIPTIAPYLLPKIFPKINEEFPDAKINIIEEPSAVLVDKVRRGEIDAAILALPYPCDGLLTLEFWQEDFYWVRLKDNEHPEKDEVSSQQVAASKLMLLKEGHCLKDHILDVCKLSKDTTGHGFGATCLNTLVQMVQSKLGTTLIPAMALKQLTGNNEKLTAIHLNEQSPHRRIAFITRPNYTGLASIEALSEICKRTLPEQ